MGNQIQKLIATNVNNKFKTDFDFLSPFQLNKWISLTMV